MGEIYFHKVIVESGMIIAIIRKLNDNMFEQTIRMIPIDFMKRLQAERMR